MVVLTQGFVYFDLLCSSVCHILLGLVNGQNCRKLNRLLECIRCIRVGEFLDTSRNFLFGAILSLEHSENALTSRPLLPLGSSSSASAAAAAAAASLFPEDLDENDMGRLQAMLEARGFPPHLAGAVVPRMHHLVRILSFSCEMPGRIWSNCIKPRRPYPHLQRHV